MKRKADVRFTAIVVVLFLTAVFSVVVGVAGKSFAQDLIKVRFGTTPFQDDLLPLIWKAKGWDKEVGLDVEIIVLEFWPDVAEAMAAGALDVSLQVDTVLLGTHQKVKDQVYLYHTVSFDDGFAVMMRKDGPFKTVEQLEAELGDRQAAVRAAALQLKGKTVVTTGNTDMEEITIDFALDKGGLTLDDFNVLDMDPNEGLTAFVAGQGDFYVGGIAQRFGARKRGATEMITGRDMGPSILVGITSTMEYAQQNPEVILKIAHLWNRMIRYVGENIEEAAPIVLGDLNKRTGAAMTTDDFKLFWQNLEHFYGTAQAMHDAVLDPNSAYYIHKRFDFINRYFYEIKGSIPQPVDSKEIVWAEKFYDMYVEKYGANETGY